MVMLERHIMNMATPPRCDLVYTAIKTMDTTRVVPKIAMNIMSIYIDCCFVI